MLVTETTVVYVIVWDGHWVGVDRDSGGYPFRTGLWGARFWSTQREAADYIHVFQRSGETRYQDMQVCEFSFTVKPLA